MNITAKDNDDLFGEQKTPQAMLVGTSYSANPLWNFEGYLKQSLQADVLNKADQGLGPFTVMEHYLDELAHAQRTAAPKLVIWEIPERYMVLPSPVNGQQP